VPSLSVYLPKSLDSVWREKVSVAQFLFPKRKRDFSFPARHKNAEP
jgi:hypothetical protein